MRRLTSALAAAAVLTSAPFAVRADATSASTAFSTAGRVEFSQNGHLTVGNDIFGIATPDYSRQIENTDVGMTVELYATGQRTAWKGRYVAIEKFLEPHGDGSCTVTWALDLKPCGTAAVANLCIEVPPESFDDLPPQPCRRPDAEGAFRLEGLFGGVVVSVAGSDGQWFFEDFRRAAWSGRFRFRCNVPYTGLTPWKGRLSMNFKDKKVSHGAFRFLDVASAANTNLAAFASGLALQSRFVPLKATSRAIVLPADERTGSAASGTLPVGFKVRRLDFLHAAACAVARGNVAFRYLVGYADGSSAEVPVIAGVDVNDAQGVAEPTHGYVVWQGASDSFPRVLCHARWVNPSPEKAVASVKVLRNPKEYASPVVLGMTALDADKLTDRQFKALENLFVNKPRNDVDMSTWYPCGLSWGGSGKTIAAGTALDASAALASAKSAFDRHVCGEFGRLVAVGDHLEFEKRPGEPVPLWGVNLAANASSPPKDLAQGLADNLKRQGVNLVRFHKFGGFPGRQLTDDGRFIPERQDRMDYFVSVLKKSGIYVYIDWEDVLCFPDLAGKWPFKNGVQWAPLFMAEFQRRERDYARALFGHKNPYTGLSYADDPAVAFIEILNEADLCSVVNANPRLALDPQFYAELDRQWQDWNVRHGKGRAKSLADDVGNPDRLRFATDVQRAYQQAQRAFLRDELGCRALVTGNNIIQHAFAATAINDGMDFAGLHGYVGHIPGYFNAPYDNTSVVRTTSPAIPFFGQTWARPADKPYCFGEWNFCYPNDYRSEGLPFTAAMMAFQGWPISLFYAFTGPMNWGEWEHYHAQGREAIFVHGAGMDPSTWGLTVPCAIAFRRGDIRPSGNVITVRHTRDELLSMGNPFQMRQMQRSHMFMLGRVYTEIVDRRDAAVEPDLPEMKGDCLVSDTGELKKFVGDGLFLLDTPRSKFAVGNLSSMGRGGRDLSGVSVKSPETFAALTLTSLDAEPTPVERARRVLICLVGNSRNEAAVIQGRTIVDPGWEKSRAVLAEPLEATVAFPHAAGPFKLYRLSTRTGERLGELPVSADGSFTIPKSAHTIYFELVRTADPDETVRNLRARADRRIERIRATPNMQIPAAAPCRYLSAASGCDSADGLTPKTAWRTIARLNRERLAPGTFVLFERGGVYRGSVKATDGMTLTAYGSGAKPRLHVSPENGADPKKWQQTDNPNVWAYDIGHDDVGTLVFDDGVAHAVKILLKTDSKNGRKSDLRTWRPFASYRDIAGDLHFWHDYYQKGTGKVYLCSDRNPGERFRSIEFNVRKHGIAVDGDDVTVDNLSIAYGGAHGVGSGSCRNLTVRNCEFAWIGGSIQGEGLFGRPFPTRFGNAIEIWGACDGYVVSNCYIRQVYDAAVTHQFDVALGHGKKRFDQRNITYADNVIENCNYSIEYFLTARNGNQSLMENVRIVNNLMFDAGYGFCEQRHDPWVASHVMAHCAPDRNRARNFLFKDNVMCFSRKALVWIASTLPPPEGGSSLPRMENNLLVGRSGDNFGYVAGRDAQDRKCDSLCQSALDARGSGNKLLILPKQ